MLCRKFIQIIFGKFIKSSFGSSKNYFLLEFWVKNLIKKIECDTHKWNHNIKSKKAKIGKRLRNDCFSCQVGGNIS